MIARSPRPGSDRGERVPPGRPRPAGLAPRSARGGAASCCRYGRGLRGQQGGRRPGKRSNCPGRPCLRGLPCLSTLRGPGAGGALRPLRSASAAPHRRSSSSSRSWGSQARRGQPERPPNGDSRGAAREERGPRGGERPRATLPLARRRRRQLPGLRVWGR